MKVQVIKSPEGEEMIVVSRADFEQLRELADDRLDSETAAAILRRIASREEEIVPEDVADRLFGGENPIKVWREYRNITQADLATKAGLSKAYLSQIESGQRGGSTAILQSIARALDVDLESVVTVSDLAHAKPLGLRELEFPHFSTEAWSSDGEHLLWPASDADSRLVRIWINVEALSDFSGIAFGVDSLKARSALVNHRPEIEMLARRNYRPGDKDVYVERQDFNIAKAMRP